MSATRARILRGLEAGDGGWPIELVMKSEARNLREIMTDLPGRLAAPDASGRRSPFANDNAPISEDQAEFIRQVYALLESHRRADEFDRLAVFAETDTLRKLQGMMPQSLRDKVVCEVPKNLLHLSAKDLPKVILDEVNNRSRAS